MAEAMGTDTAAASATEAKAKIFISYSRSDMAFVDRLEPALVARGFEVLIDREQIYAFEDWWGRLKSLVEQADTIVFSLSSGLAVVKGLQAGDRLRRFPQQAFCTDRLPHHRSHGGTRRTVAAQLHLLQ